MFLREEGLPEWFNLLYASADIPPWVLDIIVCRKMPYQSQVESVQLSNSFSCCSNLLEAVTLVCWNLTTDHKLNTLWRRKNELVFKKLAVSPVHFSTPLPKLSEIESLSIQERQKRLFDIVLDQNLGRLFELPSKWHLVFATIIHWVRKSHSHVRSYHVDGLIVGLIYLTIVEPRIGRIRSLKRLENVAAKRAKDGPMTDYVHTVRSTLKFQDIPERMLSHDTNYDRDMVHVFSEFQATFYFVHTLHYVLDTRLPCASPSDFFWATFIYNAASHFRGYDRIALAEKLFGGSNSSLFHVFQEYTSIVFELAPAELLNWKPGGPNKPRKRTKKRVKPASEKINSSESSDEEDENDNDLEIVGNRFNLLALG